MTSRRRRLVYVLFAVVAALLMTGPDGPAQSLRDRGEPRLYSGENLEAVGMPVGGIGTGNIWIAGDGSLSVWQIFNNLTESARLPGSFFAVRARAAGKIPVLCSLDGTPRDGFSPVRVASFRGDYPFACVDFDHDALPVAVRLDVFNPMIPLDVADSSLPCAIATLTARNPGDEPVEVTFAAMLHNGVGYDGHGTIDGCSFPGYGGNVNRVETGDGFTRVVLDIPDRTGPAFGKALTIFYDGPMLRCLSTSDNLTLLSLRDRGRSHDSTADAVWANGLSAATDRRTLDALAGVARDGGLAVLTAADGAVLEQLRSIGGALASGGWEPERVLFEDFESGAYDRWTVEGEAFGTAPHTGTSPRQNRVSGFLGNGLVNSYRPGDGPQGVMTSKPFTIEKAYIGFLVGGGAHAGKTCINLKVDGRVVLTATGRNNELLAPAQWHVGDFVGREAVIEIVDRASGGWGHVNVDEIFFCDTPPLAILGKEDALRTIAASLPLRRRADGFHDVAGWQVLCHEAVRDDRGKPIGAGRPICWKGPFGKGEMIFDAGEGAGKRSDAPVFDANRILAAIAGAKGTGFRAGSGLPVDAPAFGDLCFSVIGDGASACADWTDTGSLAEDLIVDGGFSGPFLSEPSPTGETRNAALALPFTLGPGEERSVDFVIAWRFPNLERYGHRRNLYADRFPSAALAESYVRGGLDRLRRTTELFRDTLYETNLPYRMIDCLSSQACIFRTVLCFFAAEHAATRKPYFAGYEGCYGCCPLNCTHVWNYAQTHARLYPEIGRNLRTFDFTHYLKEDGETQHRQHRPHGAFIDGHCAVICGAYREHLLSADGTFLASIWPGVKKATEWLIAKIDADEDGVNGGHQWNTYDVATSGAHTFIGSQYLCALAATERMATIMGDRPFAERCARIVKAGSVNQDRLLWNGDYGYYVQVPDEKPARDYDTGCHSDQLLGQWWAHMLDCGRLYPEDHVRLALRSIHRHNLRDDFQGFVQRPRRYVLDDEGGLLMCTWPFGGRPDPFILYADEVWTGIEYSTAGLMLYEGMIDEAFRIVKRARDRYDGRLREGLNSGPGGNPFCELECGRFYARALSSWSLLLAAQGFLCDGPAQRIGFLPRWKPEDHKSFFSAAEGWGLFTQKTRPGLLAADLDVRFGRLPVREIVLQSDGSGVAREDCAISLSGRGVPVKAASEVAGRLTITLGPGVTVEAGETLSVRVVRKP